MTSPPPLIFKRTKSKPAQRKRDVSPEGAKIERKDGDGEQDAVSEESPSTLATKLKNKAKKNTKTKSKLSFGGDDEEGDGEVFQVKKSSLSRKLALGKHPSSVPLNLDRATISPSSGPKYDQAYLNELKANTPSARPAANNDTVSTPSDYDSSMQIVDIDMEDSTTVIHSEASIKAAKERRERLRKTGQTAEEDFISLSVTRRQDVDQGPHPESRLVREEDELGEGDDEFAEYTSAQERIALGKKARKKAAADRREAMMDLIADAEEEDEETTEWEQEQLRRGGHRTPEPTPAQVKKVYKPAPIPTTTPLPSLTPALARLSEQMAKITASHASNTAALNNIVLERESVDKRELEMREMVEKAEEKRAWFDSFREWVEGIAGFLDEKYPMLEKLEEDQLSLLQERCDIINQRRQAEDDDDLSSFLGSLPEPPSTEPEEVDDLGRIIPKPTAAVLRRERRVARLERRRTRLAKRKTEGDEEGYSTDSSLPSSDEQAYVEAVESLVYRKKEVLADVRAEEFRDPGKGRWSIWREKYADSYINAWGGLGVVGVWEFWARLEMVGWNCIQDHRSLDSFKWYKGLYDYSRPGAADGDEELGPEGDLAASMVSTAVIPRICKLLESGALDVYSDHHIRRIIDLFEEVEASVEGENAKLQNLRKSTTEMFQKVTAETEELLRKHNSATKGPSPFNPEAIPARQRFLARRVKLLKNLLRWRKFIGEQYGIGLLVTRLVDNCILGIAESGWHVGGEKVAKRVGGALPKDLLSARLEQRLGSCEKFDRQKHSFTPIANGFKVDLEGRGRGRTIASTPPPESTYRKIDVEALNDRHDWAPLASSKSC
ncbi:GC-rich sequence DNA-binding factor 2 [Leucoagaricus sp. SymC.cos]|nr:GC-rich sequence DNA-binding factor 2 [Leucoagaricus sp. SymC.cos]